MPVRHPMVRVKVSSLRVKCQHVVDDPERKLPAGLTAGRVNCISTMLDTVPEMSDGTAGMMESR
jgi:hypothetical protein